jgi:hypothetical protein
MVSFFARRAIDAFERRWAYDATYMRDVLKGAGVDAFMPLNALGKLSRYRRGVPAAVYYAAKITASLEADCGPCAQLIVSMAEAEGVDSAILRALAASDRGALGPAERLGYDLAAATVARRDATKVREEIVRRWGMRGLVSLAYGLVTAEAFPTFKYAIGHGHMCERLRVDGSFVSREPLQRKMET